MHKFKIVGRKDGQFGVQFLYNSEIMVWSESYKQKISAINCIESIKKNAPSAAIVDLTKDEDGKGYSFQLVKSKNDQFYVRFVASNGETMVISETYTDKRNAINCAQSIQKNAPGAPVEDETLPVEQQSDPIHKSLAAQHDALLAWSRSLAFAVRQEIDVMSGSIPNEAEAYSDHNNYLIFLKEFLSQLEHINSELEHFSLYPESTEALEKASISIRLFSEFIERWISQNIDMILGIKKLGLIGLGCGFLVACGAPGYIAIIVSTAIFEGKDILDAIRASKAK